MKTHFFYIFFYFFQGNDETRTEEENYQIFCLLKNLTYLFQDEPTMIHCHHKSWQRFEEVQSQDPQNQDTFQTELILQGSS